MKFVLTDQNIANMKFLSFQSYLILSFVLFLFITSCEKDKNKYQIPTTYNFDNVDYSGQTVRIDMLTELGNYAKSGNTINPSFLDASRMKDMFNNINAPFSDTSLNASTKKLSEKTVSTEVAIFEQLMDSLSYISSLNLSNSPSAGVAGVMSNSSGTKHYLVNANGVELAQVIEKGLMGACLFFQSSAVYLGDGKMNVDNETVTPGLGTTMEHHWDEAFGYLGVPVDFPSSLTGLRFWGKYLNDRNSTLGLNSTLMNDFIAGRAAISHKDLSERDVKILSIRKNWELVIAATAVAYLNDAINTFSSDAAEKHHALSEGYAFIYSLKWAGNPTISSTNINSILTTLGGTSNLLQINFYNTTLSDVQNVKDALVAAFPGLQSVKDIL
jgi:hypothetical protein